MQSVLLLGLMAVLGACDHAVPDTTTGGSSRSTPAPAPAPPESPASPDVETPLKPSDVDAYVTGMRKEVDLLQTASLGLQQARAEHDGEAAMAAMNKASSVELDDAASHAAGMDRERYAFVKNAIELVLVHASMQEAAHGSSAVDDPYAGLAPETAMALKSRYRQALGLYNEAMAIRVRMAKT